MATSKIQVEGIGTVSLFRRKGLKYIRISIGRNGEIKLSLPWYVSKSVGLRYLISKKEWILQHKTAPFEGWKNGQSLTEDYRLSIAETDRKVVRSRLAADVLEVHVPLAYSTLQKEKAIDKAVKNFLRVQCEEKLIPRLKQLAQEGSFNVRGIKVKHLKSRWGSCSHDKDIILNASLIQLPSTLSDYVIIHELAHTKHLNHGPGFWQEVQTKIPDYKERRKALRKFNPAAIL